MPPSYDSLVTRLTASARLHRARGSRRWACWPSSSRVARGLAAEVAADRWAAADSAAAAAVRGWYPGARFRVPEVVRGPGTDYRSGTLLYDTPGDETAYGTVVALWTAEEGRLAWTHVHRGDFRPHRLVWLDADADGRHDLFFTAGEEDIFETYLFINRMGSGAAADSAFTLAYRSGNDYTTLLDLDGDGAPELIDSGHAGEEHVDVAECQDSPPPAQVEQAAAREYARRAGAFDHVNRRSGMADYADWTLHLRQPVKILQIRAGKVRDATREFSEHLRWRIGVLEADSAAATPACRAHLRRVIDHLRRAGA